MELLKILLGLRQRGDDVAPGAITHEEPSAAKLKHLEFIQAAIARMANHSFLFKGWAVTIATALAAFAAIDSRKALLAIALITTALFWGLDGYYLWLERGFVKLHEKVARTPNLNIDFKMKVDKSKRVRGWLGTLFRWHLLLFYGSIIVVDIVGILLIKGGK